MVHKRQPEHNEEPALRDASKNKRRERNVAEMAEIVSNVLGFEVASLAVHNFVHVHKSDLSARARCRP